MVAITKALAAHVIQAVWPSRVAVKDHYYAVLYGPDGTTVRVRISAMPVRSRAGDQILDHLSQSIEPLRIVFVGDPWK